MVCQSFNCFVLKLEVKLKVFFNLIDKRHKKIDEMHKMF